MKKPFFKRFSKPKGVWWDRGLRAAQIAATLLFGLDII